MLLFEDGLELSTVNSLPILVTSHALAHGEAGKARIILGLSEYEVVGMLLEHLNQGLLVRCSDGLRMATAVTVHIVADVHEVSHGINFRPIWRTLLRMSGRGAADRPKAKLTFMRVPGDITFLCSLFLVLEAADSVFLDAVSAAEGCGTTWAALVRPVASSCTVFCRFSCDGCALSLAHSGG